MKQDATWELVCKGIWKYQYVRKPVAFSSELSKTLYEATQGIADFVIKLYKFAQIRAMERGEERVTPAIIRSVARDRLYFPAPYLEALRTNNLEALRRMDDVTTSQASRRDCINPGAFDRVLPKSKQCELDLLEIECRHDSCGLPRLLKRSIQPRSCVHSLRSPLDRKPRCRKHEPRAPGRRRSGLPELRLA
jgi:hypothetical protein